MTQLLTSRQVAETLGVTISHINRLVINGTITPAVQLSGYKGSRLYDPLVIEALKEKRSA